MDKSPIFVSKHWWRVSFRAYVFFLTLLIPMHLVAQDIAQPDDQLADQFTDQVNPQNGLYTEVAVNGESSDEQLSAYRVAMRIILLQNSGDKSLLNDPDIQRALIQADSFIDDSRYRVPGSDDRITRATPLTPKVRRSNEATHLLSIRFNEALILGLIADQSAAADDADPDADLDPDAEPAVPTSALVWLVVNDGSKEHRIGGPTGANVVERLREIAGGVGQRLVFPQQDALDLQALTTVDMQSGNTQRVLTASRRYKEAVVLVGLLTREQGRSWVTNWSRYYEGSVDDFNDSASNLDQALQQGTRWLASSAQSVGADSDLQQPGNNGSSQLQTDQGFGSQNSTFGDRNNTDSSFIWISRLQSVEGYAELMQLIDEVESVEIVFPSQVLPSGMMFSVSPRYALTDVTSRLAGVPWLRASLLQGGVQGGLQGGVQGGVLQGGAAQGQNLQPSGRPDATYEYTR